MRTRLPPPPAVPWGVGIIPCFHCVSHLGAVGLRSSLQMRPALPTPPRNSYSPSPRGETVTFVIPSSLFSHLLLLIMSCVESPGYRGGNQGAGQTGPGAYLDTAFSPWVPAIFGWSPQESQSVDLIAGIVGSKQTTFTEHRPNQDPQRLDGFGKNALKLGRPLKGRCPSSPRSSP